MNRRLETGTQICFTYGAPTLGTATNAPCVSINTASSRRGLVTFNSEGAVSAPYYNNGSTSNSGLYLIPIPSGATSATFQLDRGGQVTVRDYSESGSSYTSSILQEWLSFSANTPVTIQLTNPNAKWISFTFRLNSSNTNYGYSTDYRQAILEFS